MTRVSAKTTQNPEGHIEEIIHKGFEPFFSEPMSAGNLTKDRQIGQILRLQYTAQSVQKSIPRMKYDLTTFAKIQGAYANGLTKISQSAEGPGNLLQKLKTAISISQSTTKHDETSKLSGRVKQ
jgi:hypothetical protein